jgi:hypothetical protein
MSAVLSEIGTFLSTYDPAACSQVNLLHDNHRNGSKSMLRREGALYQSVSMG